MSDQEVNIRITATDETGPAWESAGDGISSLEGKAKDVSTATQATTRDTKDVAVGLAGVTTSAFALYSAYDSLNTSQVAVDRALVTAKGSWNSVDDAQRRYNTAVEKYGADSVEAKAALDDLTIATERAEIADERAEIAQGNLSKAKLGFAVGVLPSAITMTDSMGKVIDGLSILTAKDTVVRMASAAAHVAHTIAQGASTAATWLMTSAQTALNTVMHLNPIFLVVTALAALAGALAWAYYNCEPFKNAVDAIGSALMEGLKPALDWVWNSLTFVWNTIRDNPILALISPITAVIYLLSHWSEVMDVLGRVWEAVLGGMRWVWDHTIGPILDALGWVWNTLSSVAGSLTGAGAPASGTENIQTFATGFEGVVSKPTAMIVGETGPEYVSVTPTARMGTGGASLSIHGPLVYIQGSADEKTARLASELIMKQIRRW